MDQDLLFSKASIRAILNEMAGTSISTSQRIFFGRNCKDKCIDLLFNAGKVWCPQPEKYIYNL